MSLYLRFMTLAQWAGGLTGNERSDQPEQEAEGLAQEAPVASWDFSKITVFPADRADQSLHKFTVAEAIHQATVENHTAAPPTQAAFSVATARVHMRDDVSADRSAKLLRAEAVAFGDQILFRSGRYTPDTERGRVG